MQLPILSRDRARGDHAQLTARQIEERPPEHLAVSFRDHPPIERRMQSTDIHPQPIVELPVYRGAGFLATRRKVHRGSLIIIRWRRCTATGDTTPIPRRIERPREASEQVGLENDFFNPKWIDDSVHR